MIWRSARVCAGLMASVLAIGACALPSPASKRVQTTSAHTAPSTRAPTARISSTAPPVRAPSGRGAVTEPGHGFRSSAITLPPNVIARVTGVSWRPGCPVPLSDLRYVQVRYVGFDGVPHTGELIVHADAVGAITAVMRRLYDARFPIARMRLVDDYGADDDRSTLANNTSAFNCRAVTGGGRWSQHAYGRAIDINPLQNPYVYRDGHVLDQAARPYLDRTPPRPGMITAGDVVTSAFSAAGWKWGGNFTSFKDYQHFSANGG